MTKGFPCRLSTLSDLQSPKIFRMHSGFELILFMDRSSSRSLVIEVICVMNSGIDISFSLKINVSKQGRQSSSSILEIAFCAKFRYFSLVQCCKFWIFSGRCLGRVSSEKGQIERPNYFFLPILFFCRCKDSRFFRFCKFSILVNLFDSRKRIFAFVKSSKFCTCVNPLWCKYSLSLSSGLSNNSWRLTHKRIASLDIMPFFAEAVSGTLLGERAHKVL